MRPASIIWFERLLLTALAVDLVNNWVVWWRAAASSAPASPGQSPRLILIAGLIAPALGLLLCYLVARRGSNIARWLTAILVILGTIGFAAALVRGGEESRTATFLVAAAAELGKLAAIACLFTPSAAAWFARKRAVR